MNPVLSDYCVSLTDITDEQMQSEGIALHDALHKFVDFVGKRNIFNYGGDIWVILENLRLNNLAFNARTLQSNRSIVINEYNKDSGNQTDSCLESNVVEVTLYGSDYLNTRRRISEGVYIEINLHGNCVPLTNTSLRPWFHANAPETQGKSSGEIAKALGIPEPNGKVHDPLFDARSILMGLRELVLSRNIGNPLKQYGVIRK
jgi:hypothetical protein